MEPRSLRRPGLRHLGFPLAAVVAVASTTIAPVSAQEDEPLVEGDYAGDLILVIPGVTGTSDGITATFQADWEGSVNFTVDEFGGITDGRWLWTGEGLIEFTGEDGQIDQSYVGDGQLLGGGSSMTLIGANTTAGELSGGGLSMSLGENRTEIRIPDLPIDSAGCDGVEAAFDVPVGDLLGEAGWNGPVSGLITAERIVEYSEGLQRQLDSLQRQATSWAQGAEATRVIDVPVAIGLLAIARGLEVQQLQEDPCLERNDPRTAPFQTVGVLADQIITLLTSLDVSGRTVRDAGLLIAHLSPVPQLADTVAELRAAVAIEIIERDFRIEEDEPVEYIGEDRTETTNVITSDAMVTAGTIAGRYLPETLLNLIQESE